MKIKFLVSAFISFIILHNSLGAQEKSDQKDYKGKEYKELNSRLCKGWNTWDTRSVLSHVLLPESLAINLQLVNHQSGDRLKDISKLSNGHPTTGYIETKYLLDLLTKKNRKDIIWNMALKTDFPSWSYFLRDGRTTITEAWTGGGSQNHLTLGAAIDPWFYNVLAGINQNEMAPGFKKFSIKPFIPGRELEWVNASVHTIHGTIASSWQKKQDGLILEIKVPAKTTATVQLPAGKGALITEGGKTVSGIKGIKVLESTENDAVFELGSGSFSFFISKISKLKK